MYPGAQLSSPTSIRLLTLFRDQDDKPLRCSLEPVDLADNPRFVALSYVWGTTAQPPNVVSCNGHPFQITENCYEALVHLRRNLHDADSSLDDEDDFITLWIDAICINQSDEAEKIGQIQLMGDIYKKASSVCIWLGKSDGQTDAAMAYLRTCGFQDLLAPGEKHSYRIPPRAYLRAMSRIAFKRYIEILTFTVWPRNAREKNHTTLHLPDQLLTDYVVPELLGRPWITRVWTLQEAVLNPNPWIQCGSHRLPWRSLVHSVEFISHFSRWNETSHRWISLVKMWNEIHLDPEDRDALDKSRKKFFRHATPNIIVHWLMPIGLGMGLGILSIFLTLATESVIVLYVLTAISYLYMALYFWGMANCNLFTLLQGSHGNPGTSTILNVLRAVIQEIRRRRCTEPIDRIRGIVGVLDQLGIDIKSPVSASSFGDISRELTIKWLEGCKSLNILLCCSGEELQGQPSWVPNWKTSEEHSWLDPRYLSLTPIDLRSHRYKLSNELRDKHTLTHRLRLWYASITGSNLTSYQLGTPIRPLGTPPNDGDWPTSGMCTPMSRPVWNLRDSQELVLLGKKVGEITWASQDFLETEEKFEQRDLPRHIQNMDNIRALRSRQHNGRLPYPTGAKRGRIPSHYIFDGDTSQDLLSLRRLLFSKFGRWYWLIWWFRNRSSKEILAKLNHYSSLASYHIKLTNEFAKKQRILAISSGESFGERYSNCPRGTEVGDHIFVISGISLPLVLRENPDGKTYRLMGFAEIRSASLMLGRVWWKLLEDSPLDEVILH